MRASRIRACLPWFWSVTSSEYPVPRVSSAEAVALGVLRSYLFRLGFERYNGRAVVGFGDVLHDPVVAVALEDVADLRSLVAHAELCCPGWEPDRVCGGQSGSLPAHP